MILPSESIFSTKLNIVTSWGAPIQIKPKGLNMDASHLMYDVKAIDGNNELPKQFLAQIGLISSALENSVPEQLFSSPDSQVESISCVKALSIANDSLVPIYAINQSNLDFVFDKLNLDQNVKNDIRTAVMSGKIVTTSESQITYNNWTGCGYIVMDPASGSAAYLITGGLNGSDTDVQPSDLFSPIDFLFWINGAVNDTATTTIGEMLSGVTKLEVAMKFVCENITKFGGIVGVTLQTFMDIQAISSKNISTAKQAAAYLAVCSTALLSLASLWCTGIILTGPAGIVVSVVSMMLVTFFINALKLMLLNFILSSADEARLLRRRRETQC